MKNIAVFYGGKSVEHDISVITGLQAMKNLSKTYNVIPIYIKSDGTFMTGKNLIESQTYLDFDNKVLKSRNISFVLGKPQIMVLKNDKVKKIIDIDCALLCNHGHGGEDGSLQGLCELCNMPYTSCSVASSVLCMDKCLTKLVLKSEKIPTPIYEYFDISEYKTQKIEILKSIKDNIGFPCIIKPATLGSSVGINICEDESSIEKFVQQAFVYDNKVLVEKYIEKAREFCCAVLKIDNKMFASNIQEIKKGKIYTFQDKYIYQKEREQNELSKSIEEKIKKFAKLSYKSLECDGVARIDFLYDEKQNKLYVNEINSIPGSLAFHLFSSSFNDLLNTLINEAISRNESKKEICYQFSSEAIEKFISMTDHLKYKMN